MNDKQNYRPVSASNLSKVFGKLIYSQIINISVMNTPNIIQGFARTIIHSMRC